MLTLLVIGETGLTFSIFLEKGTSLQRGGDIWCLR
jgi:hypothetical protein